MKKIILIILIFNLNILNVNSSFSFKDCKNIYFNNCPSYAIGKIGNIFEEINIKNEDGLKNNITFNSLNNKILLENNLINYEKNIIYSKYGHKYNPDFFTPKKGQIILFNLGVLFEKNDIENDIYGDFKDYNYKLLNNNKNSILTDSYQGFIEIKCKNNKIIYGNNNNFDFDSTSKPKIFKKFNLNLMKKYLQNNIKTCDNFNKLFDIKEKKEIKKIKNNTEVNIFHKIINFILNIFNSLF